MKNKSILLISLAAAIVLLLRGTVAAQDRLAPVIYPQVAPMVSFGMIGLGAGQTARINVVNLVRTPPPVAISIVQAPCRVELDLYDGQGKLIKQKTVSDLGFGQADFLDLARSELTTTVAHVDVSGAVRVGSTQPFFCNVSTTLEIFDSVTGATAAILAPPPNFSPAFVFTGVPLTPQAGQP
jgi:hypothetical protein